MCNLEYETRRARTLLRLRSKRSGSYAFYRHRMGDFAMIFVCARCSAPHYFLRVNFFLQVKHLQTLSRARQPTMYDESLR